MHVDGDQFAGRAGIAIGHRHDQRFLKRQYEFKIGMLLQRMHDRQFGGAGIAEQLGDALVFQNGEEGGAPGDVVGRVGHDILSVGIGK